MLSYMVGRCKKAARKQLEGIGVIEIILILVIIIGLVFVFRTQIQGIMQAAFDSIKGNADGINTDNIDIS